MSDFKYRIYTGGTFDLLHWGHVRFLEQCAQLGELWIGLNTDDFVKQYKGEYPILKYDEREKMLRSLSCVQNVIKNESGADSKQTIERVRPKIIAIGSDWANRDYYKQMNFTQEWLDENEIWLLYINRTQGISTSEIKERLKS